MKTTPDSSTDSNAEACEASFVCRSSLDEILRRGAQQMLASAIELEAQQYIAENAACLDEDGRRLVVRNGRLPQRRIQTAAGPMEVRQPRVNDRREGRRFASSILPPYARRSPSLDCLIPLLYLKGVSTNAMPEALEPLLGEGAKGLSASNISRLAESLSIWPERVVPKCAHDRSLAIAHGVEELLWVPDEDSKRADAWRQVDIPEKELRRITSAGEHSPEKIAAAQHDPEEAETLGLRTYLWTNHSEGTWRRRLSPEREVRDEIARRQGR